MSRAHTHKCRVCGKRYECEGTLERNHDGWPEVICLAFHVRLLQECEDCFDLPSDDAAEATGPDGVR